MRRRFGCIESHRHGIAAAFGGWQWYIIPPVHWKHFDSVQLATDLVRDHGNYSPLWSKDNSFHLRGGTEGTSSHSSQGKTPKRSSTSIQSIDSSTRGKNVRPRLVPSSLRPLPHIITRMLSKKTTTVDEAFHGIWVYRGDYGRLNRWRLRSQPVFIFGSSIENCTCTKGLGCSSSFIDFLR